MNRIFIAATLTTYVLAGCGGIENPSEQNGVSSSEHALYSGTPIAPYSVAGAPSSATKIKWTWKLDTRSAATSVKVYSKLSTATAYTLRATLSPSVTSYEHTAISGNTYNGYVVAVNMSGTTASSTVSTKMAGPTAAPANLKLMNIGLGAVRADFTEACNNESGIQLEYKKSSASTWTRVTLGRNVRTNLVKGLLNGTAYNFRARTTNAKGNSPYTSTANITTPAATVPAAPTALNYILVYGNVFAVNWMPGFDTDATAYEIYMSTSLTGTWTKLTPTVPASSCDEYGCAAAISNVVSGSSYYVRVRAIRVSTTTVASGNSNVIGPIKIGAANAPAYAATAEMIYDNFVVIGWGHRLTTNEENFEIYTSIDDGETWDLAAYSFANEGGIAVENLEPETTYKFRVVASNSAGDAAPSNIVEATTLPTLSVPAPVAMVTGSIASGNVITMNWVTTPEQSDTVDLMIASECVPDTANPMNDYTGIYGQGYNNSFSADLDDFLVLEPGTYCFYLMKWFSATDYDGQTPSEMITLTVQ